MSNISFEQFKSLCNYWGYTTSEAYQAICFVNNLACRYVTNAEEELDKNHSDTFKKVLEKNLEKYSSFYSIYRQMDTEILKMLDGSEEND